MEGLINCQNDIANRISKAYSNFKKSPRDRIVESYVESKLDNVEQLWVEFITNHQKIIRDFKTVDVEKSVYYKEDLYDATEERYVEYKSILKNHLKSFNKLQVKSDNCEGIKGSTHTASAVKLPKVTIPYFSGSYTEWVSFRDMFVSLIHSNTSIEDVEKLHYLKGHLTGEAEQLIRQIPVTSANYMLCWQQLENRYNNKRYLASCILKRLFSQRNTKVESATALRDLLDVTTDCLHSLKNINIDVSTWDIIIIHIVNYKLDPETRKQWELTVAASSSSELPTYSQFSEFLHSRFRALECIEFKQQKPSYPTSLPVTKAKALHVTNLVCEFCAENHKLCFCKKFINSDYNTRHEFVAKNRMCFNCLGSNHSSKFCKNTVSCRICKRRHHSLLHPIDSSGVGVLQDKTSATVGSSGAQKINSSEAKSTPLTGEAETSSQVVSCFSSGELPVQSHVLLATALVQAESSNGETRLIRALLDQGSQASFVTEATAQYLGIKKIPVRGSISGLNGHKNITAKYMVQLKVHSRVNPKVLINVQAYVLKTITTFLPNKKLVPLKWLDLAGIQLADPQYHTPNKIDLLLGAEVYGQVIEEGIKKGPHGSPIAQATSLGWIISGTVEANQDFSRNVVAMHLCAEDNELLRKFWEIEADPRNSPKIMTDEEMACEKYYAETTERDAEGRYVVRLPIKNEMTGCSIGSSREIAVKRYNGLMSRLNRNKDLKVKYCQVMSEYLQLDHMEKVPEGENKESIYLPHHAVLRDDKDTTQVRVVFDASSKNSIGVSLNNMLMVGPTLQPELRHLIMQWRKHKICLAADITKMYRQIRVAETDRDYQRLIWSEKLNGELEDYRLKTVTFGTSAAPYLAVKTLQQVAVDEGADYPEAAKRVKCDFYMDDLLTGCSSVKEGLIVYNEMNNLLKRGGFELQKWMTNSNELLSKIRQGNEELETGLKLKLDEVVKLLGLTWNRVEDVFQYSVVLPQQSEPVTKRKLLSEIARLFDPLGWATPSVIVAKILIQKLWITGIDWDEEVPSTLIEEWHAYRNDLPKLSEIKIPRWIGTYPEGSHVELHGFSDSSKLAYAAAVYVRVVDSEDNILVNLVAAKSKVAPIKQISIPRLELCGAVLVTRLLLEVAEVLQIEKSNIRAWTDSTVVLAWLNCHPSRWQTFVANRVSEILTNLDFHQWSHITSGQNPADSGSRGLNPSALLENKMWFNGPEFLHRQIINYSKPKIIETDLEVTRVHMSVTEPDIWNKYSSLTRLVRVVAYCRRFLACKNKRAKGAFLSSQELSDALDNCVKLCQGFYFADELAHLKKHGQYSKMKGPFKSLNPYIDHTGILRAGGRLEKSELKLNAKHPILLPRRSHLTDLIIADAHHRSLHGGPQLMLTILGTKYYILGAKYLVKAHVRKCVRCTRYRAETSTQLMGQLPAARVSPGKIFQNSGVDFAGPISVRSSKGRGHHSTKGYICLFVCMATRAIHLEAVSDLTTQGFIASFKRFVARRGPCTDLWSDNGTNFVGASRELLRLLAAENALFSKDVAECLATLGTTWHFIPPRSPNFGGIWEAGIKSTKFHLKRIIGELTLTYEELSTVLIQIEACLNSRPLSRIDSDSDSIDVLTPGHFLVGGPLITAPDYNYEQSNVSSLRRWQMTQRLMQTFWRRWSQEYLTQFLHRYKWSCKTPEPELGDVVLVKEDDLPPCRWLLGRVVAKHPGNDNLTRVVTLRVQNSLIKRPTSKLCVLPVSV